LRESGGGAAKTGNCFVLQGAATIVTKSRLYPGVVASRDITREGRVSMNSFRLAAICSHRATSILLSLLILVLPFPARAVLGDTAASVLSDQARMKGTLRSVDNRTYVMHEITSPSGSAVREFVSPQGAVFGVAWEGQFAPDLQQLLGPYYRQAQLAAASQQDASKQPRPRRAPIAIETPGLVVYETGHPRSFHGQAYIPQLVPSGVQASDIR